MVECANKKNCVNHHCGHFDEHPHTPNCAENHCGFANNDFEFGLVKCINFRKEKLIEIDKTKLKNE